jgi:hypothetical protein
MTLLKFFAGIFVHAILGSFSFYYSCQAQNIVPNASFEELYKLPGCDIIADKAEFESTIKEWMLPTKSTTDLFSTDVNDTCITSQPNSSATNFWVPTGKQMPRTGKAFAAIYESIYYREYLEIKLHEPLVPGQSYCCELYISLAEGSNLAQDHMGMYFSDTLFYLNTYNNIYLTPQIQWLQVVEDTENWVKLSASFKATSTQQYLLIGNFAVNGAVNYSPVDNTTYDISYYYIDDVSVEKIIAPSLSISGTTSVCPGDSVLLQASGWSDIKWAALNKPTTILASGSTLKTRPDAPMSYLISGTVCEATFYDTVAVDFYPLPSVHLGKDTMICSSSTLILDAGPGFSSYHWKELTGGQTLSMNQTFRASAENTYSVSVTSLDGCPGGDTLKLTHYKNPTVDLGPDIYTCKTEGALHAEGHSYDRYTWQNGSAKPVFYYNKEGVYAVSVENPCGIKVSDTVEVILLNIFIPNLITADGNGLNDDFKIQGGVEGKGTLSVYNRFGAQVYHQENYKNEWKGNGLSDGIYYYLFSHPNCEDQTGWVQLISSSIAPR